MKGKEEEKIIHIGGEKVYEHHKQIVDDNQISMRIDKFIVNQIEKTVVKSRIFMF